MVIIIKTLVMIDLRSILILSLMISGDGVILMVILIRMITIMIVIDSNLVILLILKGLVVWSQW